MTLPPDKHCPHCADTGFVFVRGSTDGHEWKYRCNHDGTFSNSVDKVTVSYGPPSSIAPRTEADEEIATILMGAWSEYVALYGLAPRGTFKQLHSMLALQGAGRKIAALFAPSATLPITADLLDAILAHQHGPAWKKVYSLDYEAALRNDLRAVIVTALRRADDGAKS